MVNSQVIQLIARALEADTELAFRLICEECRFTWGSPPLMQLSQQLATCEEERLRTLSKYFGITWGSLRRKGCVTATNKAVLQGVFGFRAEAIFNNPDLIAHDPLEGDLLEVLFNAFDGRRFNFLCRDRCGNYLVEEIRPRTVQPGVQQMFITLRDVLPAGSDIERLIDEKGIILPRSAARCSRFCVADCVAPRFPGLGSWDPCKRQTAPED